MIMGFVLLFTGLGLIIYSATTPIVVPQSYEQNSAPVWFASVIAATFAFLGTVLIVFGASALNSGWVNRWLNSLPVVD